MANITIENASADLIKDLGEIATLSHEINSRSNPYPQSKILMGGIYWRAKRIMEIADKNLDNHETSEHVLFLRKGE